MNKLDDLTVRKLKYYVYLLSDPRTRQVFYVGKGTGNRINHHLLGALEEKTKETEKVKTIREIQKAGHEVGLTVLRHGLEEKEAFEVESAMIDHLELSNLTNLVTGHHAHLRGKMSLQDIEIEYQAKPAVFDDPVILIRINKAFRHDMPQEDLYEVTRKHWKVGTRVHSFKIACAVYAGIIREIYIIQRWKQAKGKNAGRLMFDGRVAPPEIRDKYINKSVAHVWKQGSQNPIKYIEVQRRLDTQ